MADWLMIVLVLSVPVFMGAWMVWEWSARRQADAVWASFAHGQKFNYHPAKVSWSLLGSHFLEHPAVEGNHRGRKFRLYYQVDSLGDGECGPWPCISTSMAGLGGDFVSVEPKRPPRLLRRAMEGPPDGNVVEMLHRLHREKGHYVEDRPNIGRFLVVASTHEFAERVLADCDLKAKVAKAVRKRGQGLTIGGDQVSRNLEWFLMEPEEVMKCLDLLCDLAEAAERAAASATNSGTQETK